MSVVFFNFSNKNVNYKDEQNTLANEYGGRCQISIDDHCYILRLKQSDGKYKTTAWIFPEAFEVLKTLPSLQPA